MGYSAWLHTWSHVEHIRVSTSSINNFFLIVDRVRALGETDLNPVSGLGKISQLVFAWVQPSNVVANIIAGGVTEAGASQYGSYFVLASRP